MLIPFSTVPSMCGDLFFGLSQFTSPSRREIEHLSSGPTARVASGPLARRRYPAKNGSLAPPHLAPGAIPWRLRWRDISHLHHPVVKRVHLVPEPGAPILEESGIRPPLSAGLSNQFPMRWL